MSESLSIIFEHSWMMSETLENWDGTTEGQYFYKRSQRVISLISNATKALEQTVKERTICTP